MNKRDRQELKRLQEALAYAKPGTPVYDKLLEERENFEKSLVKRKLDNKTLLGVSKDTLIGCGFGLAQLAILVNWQDKKFLPKNLFNFLNKPKL